MYTRTFPLFFSIILLAISLAGCQQPGEQAPGQDSGSTIDSLPPDSTDQPDEEADDQAVPAMGSLSCGDQPLEPLLIQIAQKHSGVPYDYEDPSTQCSGMFQRFLDSVREVCPKAESRTPPASVLDSRAQGKWYYDQEALVLINDPHAQDSLIRPGMVMFYGKNDQDFYNQHPTDTLWTGDGIRHVGVVVAVDRDTAGVLQSYSLFHGRNPKYPSGISNATDYMHRREAKPDAPSFGNGPDPWVGVAPLVLPEG